MSNVQIPNLPVAIALNGTEALEAVQSGTSVQTTVAGIAQYSYAYYHGFYISQLPAASSVNSTDIFPVVQGSTGPNTGTTYKATVAQLFTSPTFTGTITLGSNLANYLTATGAAAASFPRITALGSDTNIDVHIVPKGSGGLLVQRAQFRDTSVTPDAGALNYVTQGLVSQISGTYTSGIASPFEWIVNGDTADVTGATAQNLFYLYGGFNFGGTGMKGGRIGLGISHAFNGGNSSNTPGSQYFHIGISNQTVAAYRDGGTTTNPAGQLFGFFGSSELRPGAKAWAEIKAMELNVSIDALASATRKYGITIVTSTTDAEEAEGEEAFIRLAKKSNATASIGMRSGLMFGGSPSYWGIPSYGSLIEAAASTLGTPPAMTAAYGFDASLVTFGGAFLRSSAFAVDGSGNVGSNAVNAGLTLQTRDGVNAKTATLTSVTVIDGGTFLSFPTLTVAAPPTSGTTATATVVTMGMRIVSAINAAGTGYAVADVLSIVGGTSTVTTQLLVKEVNSSGGITQAIVQTVGSYTVLPTAPISVTGGTGAGATFTLGWKILTVSCTAGTNYPQYPAPIITTTSGIRPAKLVSVMTDASATLVLNSGATTATTGRIVAVRVVTAAGAVTVAATDDVVVVNKTVGAATVANLPAGVTGRRFVIKDGKGDAATNNITITPAAGTIDGAATLVINANYGQATLVYNGTQWNQI